MTILLNKNPLLIFTFANMENNSHHFYALIWMRENYEKRLDGEKKCSSSQAQKEVCIIIRPMSQSNSIKNEMLIDKIEWGQNIFCIKKFKFNKLMKYSAGTGFI